MSKIARLAICKDFFDCFDTEDERRNMVLSEAQALSDFRDVEAIEVQIDDPAIRQALKVVGLDHIPLVIESTVRPTVAGDMFVVLRVDDTGCATRYVGKHDERTATMVRKSGATPDDKMVVFIPLKLVETECAFSAEDLAKFGLTPSMITKSYRSL